MFKCDIFEKTFTRERDMHRHKKSVVEETLGFCQINVAKDSTEQTIQKKHQKVCGKYIFSKQYDSEIKYFYHSYWRSNPYEKVKNCLFSVSQW